MRFLGVDQAQAKFAEEDIEDFRVGLLVCKYQAHDWRPLQYVVLECKGGIELSVCGESVEVDLLA